MAASLQHSVPSEVFPLLLSFLRWHDAGAAAVTCRILSDCNKTRAGVPYFLTNYDDSEVPSRRGPAAGAASALAAAAGAVSSTIWRMSAWPSRKIKVRGRHGLFRSFALRVPACALAGPTPFLCPAPTNPDLFYSPRAHLAPVWGSFIFQDYLTAFGVTSADAVEKGDLVEKAASLLKNTATIPGKVERLLSKMPASSPPDVVIVFASLPWRRSMSALFEALKAALPPSTVVIGGIARGIIGTDPAGIQTVESEDAAGIPLAMLRLPAAHVGLAQVKEASSAADSDDESDAHPHRTRHE